MIILAIDTSTSAVAVAIHDGCRSLATASDVDARAHTELLAPLIQRCLRESRLSPSDLTDVVVGTGPGPFTGLRVGLVTGVTIAHALGVPAHGVCSLDVLAQQGAPAAGGELLVASDARRKEVYWARYTVSGGRADRLTEPAVERPGDLAEEVRSLPTVGRGPVLYPGLFPRPVGILDVDPVVLAELGVLRIRAGAPMPVDPLYLRRPDATPSAGPKTSVPQGWRGR